MALNENTNIIKQIKITNLPHTKNLCKPYMLPRRKVYFCIHICCSKRPGPVYKVCMYVCVSIYWLPIGPLWATQWRMPADSMKKKMVLHQQGNQSILHKLEKWRTRPEHFRGTVSPRKLVCPPKT